MSIFYPPNPPGAGISGPDSSTTGHVATWADTTGTSLADAGFSPGDFLPKAGGTMAGNIALGGNDITGGGIVAQGVTVHTMVDNETTGFPAHVSNFILGAGSAPTSLTINLPATPVAGQTASLSTLLSSVPNLILQAGAGVSFLPAAPTSIAVGDSYTWVYVVLGPNKYWLQLGAAEAFGAFLPLSGGTMAGNITSPDSIIFTGSPSYLNGGVDPSSPGTPNVTFEFDSISLTPSPSDFLFQLYTNTPGSNFGLSVNYGNDVVFFGGTYYFRGASAAAIDCPLAIVGGPSSIDPSAVLQVNGNLQGALLPRMSTTDKNNIPSPAEGLLVYDTDLHALCVYNGTAWKTVTAV